MPDVASWLDGEQVLEDAERALRTGLGPLRERIRTAVECLQRAQEHQFPGWLWAAVLDLQSRGAAVSDDHAAMEFVEGLATIRMQLDRETGGDDSDFLVCPRCKIRLSDGSLRVGGSILARLLGRAVLAIRFTPSEGARQEQRLEALDAVSAFVCPTCRGVFLEPEL